MPTQVVPDPDHVRSLLNGLLGRDIKAERTAPSSLGIDSRVVVGAYEREDVKLGALVVADLSVAAFAGAALSLLPIGVAKESIDDGLIADNLLENFQEVLNVGVGWFTGKGNPRVVLAEVYPDGLRAPTDVKSVMATPSNRVDVEVDIAGYGGGIMRFMATDF